MNPFDKWKTAHGMPQSIGAVFSQCWTHRGSLGASSAFTAAASAAEAAPQGETPQHAESGALSRDRRPWGRLRRELRLTRGSTCRRGRLNAKSRNATYRGCHGPAGQQRSGWPAKVMLYYQLMALSKCPYMCTVVTRSFGSTRVFRCTFSWILW